MLDRLFRQGKKPRVAPERSTREITDAKKRLRSELRAAAYFYNDEKFIVCSIANITEYGEPIVLEANASEQQLGVALCDKLLQYQANDNRKQSKSKLEDWAAFKASGAKSGRAFEQNSIYVYVTTINTAINIDAAPRVSNEQDLQARCVVSNGRTHSEIGMALRKAIKAAMVLRNAGML